MRVDLFQKRTEGFLWFLSFQIYFKTIISKTENLKLQQLGMSISDLKDLVSGPIK